MPFKVATVLGAVIGLCAHAAAQFPVSLSLEAEVGASGVVVVGTIESLSRVPEEDSKEKLTLVIRVTKTLKGAPIQSLTLAVEANTPPDQYLDWQKRGVAILWFADEPPAEGKADPVDRFVQGLSGGPGKRYGSGSPDIVHWAQPLNGIEKGIEVVDMEFGVLRTEAAVLNRIRRAVKEMPGAHPVTLTPPWYRPNVFEPDPDPSKRPTMHWFTYVPHDLRLGAYLAMPIGPRLEMLARRLIVHPESVLPSHPNGKESPTETLAAARDKEAAHLRAAAIRSLACFKSAKNIGLVEKYANDPYTERGPDGRSSERIVRDAARWLLSGWGVELPAAVSEYPFV